MPLVWGATPAGELLEALKTLLPSDLPTWDHVELSLYLRT